MARNHTVSVGVINVYYKSGWEGGGLHFCFGNDVWRADAKFVRAGARFPGWLHARVEVDLYSARSDGSQIRFEFVPHDKTKTYWDNPPTENEGVVANYVVPISIEELKLPYGVSVVLRDGSVCVPTAHAYPWALVADLDGTLIGDDYGAVKRFQAFWELQCMFCPGAKCHIVYNTGRNKSDMLKAARENHLPRPAFCICGVGTEIYVPTANVPDNGDGEGPKAWWDCGVDWEPSWLIEMRTAFGDRDHLAKKVSLAIGQHPVLKAIDSMLSVASSNSESTAPAAALPPEVIAEGDFRIHGSAEHDPFRLPCTMKLSNPVDENLDPILVRLRAFAKKRDLRVIVSGEGDFRFVDVAPSQGGKGRAIEYLVKKGLLPPAPRVLVAGDSGNDLEMYQVQGVKGVVVSNSQEGLLSALGISGSAKGKEYPLKWGNVVYYAEGHIGDGVEEAIRRYFMSRF